jgi:hypothetical protein
MIEFLPFPTGIFSHHGSAAIDPNSLSFFSLCPTVRTTKIVGVNGILCPVGGKGAKSIHKQVIRAR